MTTSELTSERSSSLLDNWWLPFLWITLTPIVTVPFSAVLFGELAGLHAQEEIGVADLGVAGPCSGSWFCVPEYSEVVPTLIAFALPGLLNLIPFAWTLSESPRVRPAGIVAGLLGLVRLSIPLLVLGTFDTVTSPDGTAYFQYGNWVMSDPHVSIWLVGALAWVGSLLVWGLFAWLSRGSSLMKEGV